MSKILDIFSTREIALVIWLLISLSSVCIIKDIRYSIIALFKAVFAKKLVLAFSTLLLYLSIIVFLLSSIKFWNVTLLKDTILWFLFSGIILFGRVNKIENMRYFSHLVRDNIKIIVIWEFLFNSYTLSLPWELMLIPVVSLLTITEAFADHFAKQDTSYKKVALVCRNILGIVALIMVGYVTYKTITEYKLLLSISNLESFLLPIVLLLFTLPYFYALALYVNYESFIVAVRHVHGSEEPEVNKGLIKATLKYANVDIGKLKRIWKYQANFDPSKEDPDEYIKRCISKPKYVISNKAKLMLFNDIQTVIKNLSNIGIGELDEWHKSYSGDDCYLSMTRYYQFGIDDLTIIPNTLAFYLTGEETYIKQLKVVLDIGYEQNKNQAIEKFITVLTQTFDCLNIPISSDLVKSIIEDKEYSVQYNTHSVSLNYSKYERIENYTLNINTC